MLLSADSQLLSHYHYLFFGMCTTDAKDKRFFIKENWEEHAVLQPTRHQKLFGRVFFFFVVVVSLGWVLIQGPAAGHMPKSYEYSLT